MNPFEREPKQESLEDFQQEIENLKEKEIEEKEKMANRNLVDTQTEKLTLDDMKVWQNYKKLTIDNITEDALRDFREYVYPINPDKEPGRRNFAAFLADRIQRLWGKKELKEIKK